MPTRWARVGQAKGCMRGLARAVAAERLPCMGALETLVGKGARWAYKPGSVADDHLSTADVTARL